MSRKKLSLARGRPPAARKPSASLSASATRTIIRSHHRLQKARAHALKTGDNGTAAALAKQIESEGGLEAYQQASITGQSASRGGDSSRLLMQWLQEADITAGPGNPRYRLLEVGALSPNNACSKSKLFDVTRIDLNSQHPSIEQQDFMERPTPVNEADKFDIISLSLVLNYVPDSAGRGSMLGRTRSFLRRSTYDHRSGNPPATEPQMFPSLFLVLPEPCVNNSRYMTKSHLVAIMASLGYVLTKDHTTTKLFYSLWTMTQPTTQSQAKFPKKELVKGRNRNNFCVTLT